MDIGLSDLLDKAARHPEVPIVFVVGSLFLGSGAWWLAPRQGWARGPAALAACGLMLALAVTVVRPAGLFPPAGFSLLNIARECMVGDLSLARTYEKLNVAMLMPFAFFGTLATRRPVVVAASGLLVSGFVEVVQVATGGGTCQARDLVHNTAGVALSVLLAMALLGLRDRRSGGVAGSGASSGSSH
ncbi:MAG: VanZ family protein [Pseudonocardiales bacterium]